MILSWQYRSIKKKKQEINIEDYQKKKKMEKENMVEIDIIESLKKLDKKAKKYSWNALFLNK